MQQFLIIFLSKGSAEILSQRFCSNFNELQLEEKKRLVFFEELLFVKGKVYVDFDFEHLITCELEKLDSVKERPFALFLRKLSANDKLHRCDDEMNTIREQKLSDFDNLQVKPNYVFLNADYTFCKRIALVVGVICISNDFFIHESNMISTVKVIEIRSQYLTGVFQNSFSANSIVIEDPYIFKSDVKCKYIDDLLTALNLADLKVKSIVTFIFSNNDQDFKEEHFLSLTKKYGNIDFEKIIRDKKQMHDRNIYANTFWISSDYGFKSDYNTTTKWNIFPIGIYFSAMIDRKKSLIKYVKASEPSITNPLLVD